MGIGSGKNRPKLQKIGEESAKVTIRKSVTKGSHQNKKCGSNMSFFFQRGGGDRGAKGGVTPSKF